LAHSNAGDTHITDRYEAPLEEEVTRLPPGPYILNITDEEIITGYELQHNELVKKILKPSLISVAGLATFVVLITTIVLWRLRKRKRRLQRQLERRNRRAMWRKRLARRQTRLGLIAPVISNLKDSKDKKTKIKKKIKQKISSEKKKTINLGKRKWKEHVSTDSSSDDDESTVTNTEEESTITNTDEESTIDEAPESKILMRNPPKS